MLPNGSLYRNLIVILAMLVGGGFALAETVEAATLRLTWNDNSSNESGFKVERQGANGGFTQIASVGASVTSYTDSGLTSGQTYCYTVRAFNSAGSSNPSNLACGTTATNTSSSTTTSSTGDTSTSTKTSRSIAPGVTSALVLLSDNSVFVHQQYFDFLDREPDSEGLATWVNALNSGFSKASMIEIFLDSGEFRFKGKFIAEAYLGILARDAEYAGFRAWLGVLLAGMSREEIVQFFLESDEFKSQFGSNLTNGEFVDRMYANVLLRRPETAGFNFWVSRLNKGQMTRAQVALGFLDSAEFQNLSVSQNRLDILLLYFNLLRRDPDAEGFAYWLDALNSGLPLTTVIDAFLMSGEYQAQF